jgi:hypothetical protein
VSAQSPAGREGYADTVAGFLAALAIFVSAIGIAYKPVRVLPGAIIAALIAVAMGGRHERLASFAVIVSAIAWVVGMTIAVAAEKPLW